MLTEKQKQLLDTIKRHASVKDAAAAMGISVRTAYNMLYKLRKKYRKQRGFVNAILSYRRTSGHLNKLLSTKQPLWKEIKELEKEEL